MIPFDLRLYSPPRPHTLPVLIIRLENLLQSISIETIEKAHNSFIKHCNLCVAAEGRHFEQLL